MKHALSILILRARSITRKKLAAFSMIEALLAGSLLALVVFILSGILIFGQESSRIAGDSQRATALAEEGLEAVHSMSEASFSSLTAGPHGLAVSGGKWQFLGTQDYPEIFTRSLIISDLDANTKAVTSTVSWAASSQRNGSISLTSRFTNWRRIGSPVMGNWASTTVAAGYNATLNGRVVRVSGNYAYVGLVSGANNFKVFDISSPATPSLVGQTTVAGNINDMEVSGNYVYVASTDNTNEMRIVDVTTKTAPTLRGSYQAAGYGDGLSVDVIGTTVYLGRAPSAILGQNEFYIIDAASSTAPALLGSLNLIDSVFDIQVSSDSYAYLATSGNTSELNILNVSNPAVISSVGTFNIVGSNTGRDAWSVAIFDSNTDGIEDRAIVARTAEGRLWPFNVSNPASPSLIISPNGYTVPGIGAANITYLELFNSNKYLALATNAATAEVVIVDITTLVAPTVLSTTNIAGASNFAAEGLAYAAGVDRLLTVGTRIATNNYSLVIIKPN